LSQPLVTRFYVNPDFHTLIPNTTATARIDNGVLRGLDSEITIRIDSNGFRTDLPDAYKKRFKIFMVGGSTMEQIYLNDRKTTAALLEREIENPDYSVINTGVAGLRTLHHIATINEIKKYEPYLIVVLLGINDWQCEATQ